MVTKVLLPENVLQLLENEPEETETKASHRAISNTVMQVRDRGAEYMLRVRERLALVVTNRVNDPEEMEGICGEALIAFDELIMLNLTIGAKIRPDAVVDQKIDSLVRAMPKYLLVSPEQCPTH